MNDTKIEDSKDKIIILKPTIKYCGMLYSIKCRQNPSFRIKLLQAEYKKKIEGKPWIKYIFQRG